MHWREMVSRYGGLAGLVMMLTSERVVIKHLHFHHLTSNCSSKWFPSMYFRSDKKMVL